MRHRRRRLARTRKRRGTPRQQEAYAALMALCFKNSGGAIGRLGDARVKPLGGPGI